MSKPKILLLDIETAPIIAHVWDIWEQNVGLNQIVKDWHILSWSAKWLGEPASKVMYQDQRKAKKIEEDKNLLKGIWQLLDEADVIITQNGKAFDEKKLNTRFLMNGMHPPSSYRHIDTKQIAKRKFAFTSNRLEYMGDKLNKKYKKQKHKRFLGHELWTQCLAGNLAAWKEMEKYNKYDVLALEELYNRLQPWDNSINFNLYNDTESMVCACGCKEFKLNGFAFNNAGKFQRYKCVKCGAETRSRSNLLTKEKRASLRVKV